MSSSAFSTFTLELRPAWLALAGLLSWLALLAAALGGSDLPEIVRDVLAAGLGLAGAVVLRSPLFGGTGRGLFRTLHHADGSWSLVDGHGRRRTGRLSARTHLIGRVVLLRREMPPRFWVLLGSGSQGCAALRRLRVRLRFG